MKKLFLVFLTIQLTSCGKNKEEQMFYDFIDDASIKSVNISAKELDLKIIKLEKIGVIVAKDSIEILSKELNESQKILIEDEDFIAKNLKEKENYELKINNTNNELKSIYQEIIDNYQELIDTKKKYYNERQMNFNKASNRLKELKLDTSKVISTKYEVSYSMHMPDTDITNTFKGFAYTNPENSRFLRIIE